MGKGGDILGRDLDVFRFILFFKSFRKLNWKGFGVSYLIVRSGLSGIDGIFSKDRS